MPSSALEVSPSSPKPSNSDVDDGDDEYEYEYEEIEEEIEVEEEVEVEVEVEEEIEEDVEEEEEEVEEEEEQVEIGEGANESQTSENVEEEEELEDNETRIGDQLTPVVEENQGNDANQILETEKHEEPIKPGLETSDTSVSKPLEDILTRQESVGGFKVPEPSENELSQVKGEIAPENDVLKADLEENGEVNDVKSESLIQDNNMALTADNASTGKDNDVLSNTAETNPAAVEVEDEDMQISPTRVVEDVKVSPRLHVPQIRRRDLSSSVELDGENKRQKINVCEFYAKGWCIKGVLCRFPHVKEGLDATVMKSEDKSVITCYRKASSNTHISAKNIVGENSKLNNEAGKSTFHKNDASRSVGSNPYAENPNNCISPFVNGNSIDRNSNPHGNFSSSFVMPDYLRHNTSGIVLNERRSSDLTFSHPRQPLSFHLSSWNTNNHGTYKPFESNLDCRPYISSSVQRCASPFSYHESGSFSRNHIFKDPNYYKSKASINDWEPSVPFRPSHQITINLLSKETLYDLLRDSIEQTKVRDELGDASNSVQGSSLMNVNMQSNNSKEENKVLTSVNVGDARKFNLVSSSDDNGLNLDKQRDRAELKVDESRKNNETDVDSKKEGHVQNEEKALKHFQAALIEYVKELVKPTWRDGLMSKDAHKLIVKKSVDKVLSSLQHEQIPNTSEQIKLYLSCSHSKLAKLVEAYIEKYGKS